MAASYAIQCKGFQGGAFSATPLANFNGCFPFRGGRMGRISPFNIRSTFAFRLLKNGNFGLSVRGCFDARKTAPHHDTNSAISSAHAAYVSRLQLLRDDLNLDLGGSQKKDSSRGSSLLFPDDRFPEKIAVAVDVDEVLGHFVAALNRFIADRYSSNHSVSEYYVYEFFRIWNCSRDEADVRVHEFFKTHYFKTGIYPIPGAWTALSKLSKFCKLSVVTSRQNVIKDHTIEWIEKYFPGLFQEIHFGNHFALDGVSKPKSEICKSLGASVLIDDNPRYATECAEVGIKVLLFDYKNSYPWCKAITEHPLVTKVQNWEEVEQQLMSWILSQYSSP